MSERTSSSPEAGLRNADATGGWQEGLQRLVANGALPFYRAYPHDGPSRIVFLHHRGAYSAKDRFFYNRIPKSANSTVMRVLFETSPEPSVRDEADYKRAYRKHYLMSPGHVRELTAGAYFRFTFVRNPFARAASAYKGKMLGGRPQLGRFAKDMGCGPGEVPSFAAFCRFLDRGGLYLDAHWTPQVDLMLLPLEEFDFIGRVETLAEDLDHVLASIGRSKPPVALPHIYDTSKRGRTADLYDEETLEIVRRLYARDFEALGFDPERPPWVD